MPTPDELRTRAEDAERRLAELDSEIAAHTQAIASATPASSRGAIGPYVPGEGSSPSTPLAPSAAEVFAQFLRDM